MPLSDLHDPEDREATGTKVRYLYCPECGNYSGGGVCRMCERGYGEFTPPVPESVNALECVQSVPTVEPEPFVAIVCSRGRGCEVVELAADDLAAPARSMISATDAADEPTGPDSNTIQQEALL